MARKVRDLKQTENGVQLRNEAADVRLIEQILDPLLESMLGIRFRKKKKMKMVRWGCSAQRRLTAE